MTHTITFVHRESMNSQESETIEVDLTTYNRINAEAFVKFKGNIYQAGNQPDWYYRIDINIDCTCYAKDAPKGRIGCC